MDAGPHEPRSDAPSAETSPADRPAGGPTAVVDLDGVSVTLLGTAHVSRASADEVRGLIAEGGFDAVAIELDASRHAALTDPDRLMRTDLFTVFRRGQGGAMAANLALGAFQQRLADQYGIEPGQEMRDAIRAADEAGVPLLLVDRDIGTTLRRVYRNVPWWRRLELMAGLVASVLSREEIDEEEIERLKDGDVLEATFAEFADTSERLYRPLIAERDEYMAARLRQEADALRERATTDGGGGRAGGAEEGNGGAGRDAPRLLAVIGAGHLSGIEARLRRPADTAPEASIAALDEVPPPSKVTRAFPWLIVALIVTGFAVGFARDPDLGRQLVGDWFLINAVTTAVGTLAAAAHPFTVIGTVLAAPFTSLNPMIGAGFVAVALELWRRKPSVGDFATLRRDTTRLRGWYRNRVARTLLVFLGATLGSAVGTYLAGARILTRLF